MWNYRKWKKLRYQTRRRWLKTLTHSYISAKINVTVYHVSDFSSRIVSSQHKQRDSIHSYASCSNFYNSVSFHALISRGNLRQIASLVGLLYSSFRSVSTRISINFPIFATRDKDLKINGNSGGNWPKGKFPVTLPGWRFNSNCRTWKFNSN